MKWPNDVTSKRLLITRLAVLGVLVVFVVVVCLALY